MSAVFNVRSTRESTRDPGAEKASLAKFCKGCTHQHVFGCEVGVLLAVPPEDIKVSPITPRTYTLYAFAPAPYACAPVCKNRHTGASVFTATRNTFYDHLSPNCHQIYLPSCRSAPLQAFSTEITAAFVAAEDTVAGWPSFSGADVGIA